MNEQQREPMPWITTSVLMDAVREHGSTMTNAEIIELLKPSCAKIAAPVASADALDGMVMVPRESVQKIIAAMDAIYNHNLPSRQAVIQHYGIIHDPILLDAMKKETP